MNISRVYSSLYSNIINNTQNQNTAEASTAATKQVDLPKPDAITSATVKNGGDHHFEARA